MRHTAVLQTSDHLHFSVSFFYVSMQGFLGCHVAALTYFTVTPTPYDAREFESKESYDSRRRAIVLHPETPTLVMDWFLQTIRPACNHSHFLLSDSFRRRLRNPNETSWEAAWYTCDLITLLKEFCTKEPERYGQCVATPYTRNHNHAQNVNDNVQTVIWVPPNVEIMAGPTYDYRGHPTVNT